MINLNQLAALGLAKVAAPGNENPKTANKVPMELYRFLGNNAQDFHDKGWRPTLVSNEKVEYRPTYPAFNLQRKAGEKEQSYMAVVAKPNGTFDVEMRDSKGKPLGSPEDRFVLRNVDYNGLNKWMGGIVGYRGDQVQNNTNPDRLINGAYVQLKDQ